MPETRRDVPECGRKRLDAAPFPGAGGMLREAVQACGGYHASLAAAPSAWR